MRIHWTPWCPLGTGPESDPGRPAVDAVQDKARAPVPSRAGGEPAEQSALQTSATTNRSYGKKYKRCQKSFSCFFLSFFFSKSSGKTIPKE